MTYGKPKLPSDHELVARAVRNARHRDPGPAPRWSAVMDTFALGSTYATYLCRDHGFDPDEQIGSWPEPDEDDDSQEPECNCHTNPVVCPFHGPQIATANPTQKSACPCGDATHCGTARDEKGQTDE